MSTQTHLHLRYLRVGRAESQHGAAKWSQPDSQLVLREGNLRAEYGAMNKFLNCPEQLREGAARPRFMYKELPPDREKARRRWRHSRRRIVRRIIPTKII